MTLTSYTKYCLEHGDKLNVYIISERATPAQLQAMANCDAMYDAQEGFWFVEMTKENYKIYFIYANNLIKFAKICYNLI